MGKSFFYKLAATGLGLFSFFPLMAQHRISGTVVNVITQAPVPGCSVFINNTAKGTVTNNAGHFELSEVPAGKHDLVISSVGYETNVFSFSDEQLPLTLKIELKQKIKELASVTIEASVEEGWNKWGKLFTDNFIGDTKNASQCTIRNQASIKFRYYKKSQRLVAYSDEVLIIENKALGYTIHYQLEDFEVNFKEKSQLFLGYSLFNEKPKEKKLWERRRREAYQGSIMHFLRSLYKNDLTEEGFEARRMWKIPNAEKLRVKAIYDPAKLMYRDTVNGVVYVKRKETYFPADSVDYYERVLRQDDYKEVYGQEMLTADSLIVNKQGAYQFLHFNNYIFVTYKKAIEEDGYPGIRNENRKPGLRQSYLFIPNGNTVMIEANGNYEDPQDLFSMGYWGWSEKMANMLPMEYEPGK